MVAGFVFDDDPAGAGLARDGFGDCSPAAPGFTRVFVAAFFLEAVVVFLFGAAAGGADFFALDAARVVFFLGPDFLGSDLLGPDLLGPGADFDAALLRVDVFFTADFFDRVAGFRVIVFDEPARDVFFFVVRAPREPVVEAFLATCGALVRG